MLEYLHLKNVGPAPEMRMELAERLNLITGDNGLGKSFLLDIAWWTLTRTWVGYPARPNPGAKEAASIGFAFESKSGRREYVSEFDRKQQEWKGKVGRPANPGLVLYAQVDGGFAVWDPARNYWRTVRGQEVQDRPPAYVFSPNEVWDGLERDGATLCNGLIRDWASWQKEKGTPFELLKAALQVMSPSAGEPLVPGPLTRISLDDVRDMPTLRMPYGEDTPIVQASAGMRRITALVYLLVWAWEEHQRAAALLGQEPSQQVIFLVDELDTHLHPRWQRVVLRALLDVVGELMTGGDAQVQVLAATHSPLVMASVEPHFDPAQDALWHLDLADSAVRLTQEQWAKQGDVLGWLVSETFGLAQARSRESEEAIEAAEAFMRRDLSALPSGLRTRNDIDAALARLLPGHDPFWPRWVVKGGAVEGKATGKPRKKQRAKATPKRTAKKATSGRSKRR
jgi:hypothetical protein